MDEEMPFPRDTPFDSIDKELDYAAALIERELPGFALERRAVPSPPSHPERPRVSFVSPTIEELQDYYRLSRRPNDPNAGGRTRIYRIYPLRMLEQVDEREIARHATILYRLIRNEVVGELISYEA
jgi:hypothetical protein